MARIGLWGKLKRLALTDVRVIARGGVDAGSIDRLEEVLLTSDFGTAVTDRLVDEVERQAERGQIRTGEDF